MALSVYIRCASLSTAILPVLRKALGVKGVVNKRREVFLIGRSRIHLDEVVGLGTFVELEVVLGDGCSRAECERMAGDLLTILEIPESALTAHAYIDLLLDRSLQG